MPLENYLAISLGIVAVALGAVLLILFRLSLRTRQLAEAGREAAAARDRAQVLLAVAEAVNSSISLEEVLHVALTQAARIAEAPAGAIYLARPGHMELTRESAFGISPRARGHIRLPDREPFQAALAGNAVEVRPLAEHDSPGLENHGHPGFVLVLPIRRVGKLMGAMELYLTEQSQLTRDQAEMLQGIGAQAATAIRHAQLYREQEESSLTDELTHLANRRYLAQRYLQEMQRARRHRKSLAILMMDIDHFKLVNDTHGHLVGDAVLAEVAQIITRSVRDSDVSARYGGEEFAVILSESDLDGAMRLAGRLRAAVEAAEFPSGLRVTISIGVAATAEPERLSKLLEEADRALYDAKRNGRNRVEAALLDRTQGVQPS